MTREEGNFCVTREEDRGPEGQKLVTIMMPAGMFLGLLVHQANNRTQLSHVVSLSEPEQGTYLLTPEPFPMDLVDATIGDDMEVTFNDADAVMCCELPLQEDSPHSVVRRFIEYWGLAGEAK